jgi:hypothetical protein
MDINRKKTQSMRQLPPPVPATFPRSHLRFHLAPTCILLGQGLHAPPVERVWLVEAGAGDDAR